MTITERIFDELHKKGISQKEFAQAVGINEKTVSALKKNNTPPNAEKISIISDFLEISIDYLLTGSESKSGYSLNALELDCLTKFNKLLEIDQIRILERMETIYDTYSPEQKGNAS